MTANGTIVILNGTPRSGKSSLARAIQDELDGTWINLGVDVFSTAIPERWRPGIGLRPGDERPELEPLIPVLYDALYGSVVACSRRGLNVVVDVGHHDDYSEPLGILGRVATSLEHLPAYLIGVRCGTPVILARRQTAVAVDGGGYVTSDPTGAVPEIVLRWERAVHDPGIYDLEVDTAALTPREGARAIGRRMDDGPPTAWRTLAKQARQRATPTGNEVQSRTQI